MKPFIYMDNAATTKAYPQVVEAMLPYFTECFGNPSSIYTLAEESRKAVTCARDIIANTLEAKSSEIYFTAGGSESDNWAIKAVAEAYGDKGRHIITSKVEHHAVLHTCQWLETKGYEVSYVDVDENGMVDLEKLEQAVREDTILITVMTANNEIGTIQPVLEIGEIARKHNILFHTDAVQAFGRIPLSMKELPVDLLSASGHKLHGPKGIGFLYIKKGLKVRPLIHGGAQERNRRAGTENVPGIVGFGKAVEISVKGMEDQAARLCNLRNDMIERLEREIPHTRLNGHRTKRLPGNVNISFRFVEGESLLIRLDRGGICASSGSACTSGSLDPSHVLLAIGLPHEIAHGSIRLTLSDDNTKEEVDIVVDKLKEIVSNLRDMSPLYEDFLKEESENV